MNDWIPAVGDFVWFDYHDILFAIKGQVKKVFLHEDSHSNDYVDVYVGKHGIGKIPKYIANIYPSKEAYETARRAKAEERMRAFREEIKTVDDLLLFLDRREMLIKGEASDEAWQVVKEKLDAAQEKDRERARKWLEENGCK